MIRKWTLKIQERLTRRRGESIRVRVVLPVPRLRAQRTPARTTSPASCYNSNVFLFVFSFQNAPLWLNIRNLESERRRVTQT